jgi:hypothetical protein
MMHGWPQQQTAQRVWPHAAARHTTARVAARGSQPHLGDEAHRQHAAAQVADGISLHVCQLVTHGEEPLPLLTRGCVQPPTRLVLRWR